MSAISAQVYSETTSSCRANSAHVTDVDFLRETDGVGHIAAVPIPIDSTEWCQGLRSAEDVQYIVKAP